MTNPTPSPATRSRWLDWQPKPPIFSDSPRSGPTKPSEPGFAGFEGAVPPKPPKIEVAPAELARASRLLSKVGVRLMRLEGKLVIGLWSDLDGPAIRAALRTMGSEELPLRYLDGSGIPACYKLRRVSGEPVPMNVLAEMESHPAEPWNVRDRMLREMSWSPNPMAWTAWKAASLNKLFQQQGVTRQLGRITARTVRHREQFHNH